MVYFESEDKKIPMSPAVTTEFQKLVAEELRERSYRGDLVVGDDDKVVALIRIYGNIIIEKEVF